MDGDGEDVGVDGGDAARMIGIAEGDDDNDG